MEVTEQPQDITDSQSYANEVRDLREHWPSLSLVERGRRIRIILEDVLKGRKQTHLELSRNLGVSHDAVFRAVKADTVHCALNAPSSSVLETATVIQGGDRVETTFPGVFTFIEPEPESCQAGDLDGAYDTFREWIGWDAQPKPREPRPRGEFIKRIVINDLHIPYMCADSFRQMIDAEAEDTDELIIAGDIATMANFSAFPKFSRTYTPVEGFVETTKIMQYLNETFPRVVAFSGNHDNRFVKWLVKDKGVPPEILEYFECLAPNFTDPLRIICRDLENVTVVEPIQYEQANFGFLYQFGDFVVTHAETYSKIPNRATTNVAHWIKSFAEPCGIVGVNSPAGKAVRCVGQAHTHQAGKVFSDYGVWAFELGCMTQMEEYVGSPRIMTPRPWVKGYTKVIQDLDGNTLINDSNFIHTGKF